MPESPSAVSICTIRTVGVIAADHGWTIGRPAGETHSTSVTRTTCSVVMVTTGLTTDIVAWLTDVAVPLSVTTPEPSDTPETTGGVTEVSSEMASPMVSKATRCETSTPVTEVRPSPPNVATAVTLLSWKWSPHSCEPEIRLSVASSAVTSTRSGYHTVTIW